LPDLTLVVEQTIATLWAGVQAVPRLPKSANRRNVLEGSTPRKLQDRSLA
jgi:hypothetical protein